MTPAERAFWTRANRRAAGMEPEIQQAVHRAFQIIRDSLNEAELERVISSGNLDKLFSEVLSQTVMDRAFIPLRQRLRAGVDRSVKFATTELPKGGKVNGELAVTFDYLSPKVIDAVRALDTRVIATLQGDVRESVRAFVENGLRDGAAPRAVARQIRGIVGLAPNQELAVRNFRKSLEAGDTAKALGYQLRDRRFDRTLTKGDLTDTQIDTMTDAYRRKFIGWNAETNARTATLDAQRLGQHLAWGSAADQGIVDRSRMVKRWVGVMDDRERLEHVAMEGETVPMDEPYSNGEMVPGESTFNCRCISVYREMPAGG